MRKRSMQGLKIGLNDWSVRRSPHRCSGLFTSSPLRSWSSRWSGIFSPFHDHLRHLIPLCVSSKIPLDQFTKEAGINNWNLKVFVTFRHKQVELFWRKEYLRRKKQGRAMYSIQIFAPLNQPRPQTFFLVRRYFIS